MQHDALKQYYEISNFRLGGRYDLSNPASWEFGGEGGKTLESLGGKLRTAYLGRVCRLSRWILSGDVAMLHYRSELFAIAVLISALAPAGA
jgi:hypothetical protein